MSIGVIATLQIREGKGAEFEALFAEHLKQVRANEPGTLVFQLTRSRVDPATYKVLEVFQDEAALAHHAQTEYAKVAIGKLGALLAAEPAAEILDGVG